MLLQRRVVKCLRTVRPLVPRVLVVSGNSGMLCVADRQRVPMPVAMVGSNCARMFSSLRFNDGTTAPRRRSGLVLSGLAAFTGIAAMSCAAGAPSVASMFEGNSSLGGNKRSLATANGAFGGGGSLIELSEPVKLFQYATCPFCNKAQAFMEFHSIPYDSVEVNPLSKEQIKFSSYKMVPLALINGEQVNGSNNIIDVLQGGPEVVTAMRSTSEVKWLEWVDDHLVHLLPPNIYRTPREALQAFDFITAKSGDFTFFQRLAIRYAGAVVMFMVAKRARKKYNLSEDPRRDLADAVERWTKEGLAGGAQRFHGGDKVDSADLAVYGVLRSIDGNYQTWDDLRIHDFEHKEAFWQWFEALKAQVAANKFQN